MRAERKKHDLSQTELAERLGVAQTTVSKIERGELDDRPDSDTLRPVLEWLALSGSAPRAVVLPPEPRATAAAPDQTVDAERLVSGAVQPSVDLPRDVVAVAREVAESLSLCDDPELIVAAARVWLDAARSLRAAGVPLTARALLVQSTVTLLREKPR